MRRSAGTVFTPARAAWRRPLIGDAIGANLLLLGIAYQKGLVPISADAIEEAIVLNGVAVQANREAFNWGRRYVVDAPAVMQAAGFREAPSAPPTLDELISRRETHLSAYQDTAYARRYRALVDRVRRIEGRDTARPAESRGSGGAKLCQVARLQRRVRSCATAHGRGIQPRIGGGVRGQLPVEVSSCTALARAP